MELEPADAPPRGPDPFNAAEEVVDRVLRHVQRLQSSGQAGDADAARRLPAALASLEDQLSALDAAVAQMARAPERFGLPPATVRRRRELVEALKLEAAAVARAASGGAAATSGGGGSGNAGSRAGAGGGGAREASGSGEFQDVDLGAVGSGRLNGGTDTAKASRYYSDHISAAKQPQRQPPPSPPYSFNTRTAVPSNPAAAARRGGDQGSHGGGAYGGGSSGYGGSGGGGAYGGGGGGGDEEGYLHQEMQRHMMREQDEMLGDIEMQVGRIKQVGLSMNEELEQQHLLIGDLTDHTDTSQLRLRGLRKRIREVTDAARNDGQLKLIAVLCVVLAVLVVTSFL